MTTAILLISEQTLPNVLFLKQFGPFDRFVFLTTERMEREGRSDWIIKSARLFEGDVTRLKIDPENANLSLKSLEQFPWPKAEQYWINLTGGTKMMALAAFSFFAGKPGCRVVYLPINSSVFLEIHPEPQELPLEVNVSLEEYLSAYGAVIQSQDANWMPYAGRARQVMDTVLKKGGPDADKKILSWLDPEGRDELSAEDKKFYSGQWFEIWLAWAIHYHLGIPETDIRVEVKLNRIGVAPGTSFEYDVMFVKNSRLYVAECKYFPGDHFQVGKINKELFKFASMNAQLGLFARPFFAIGNKISQPAQQHALHGQCDILRLKYPADITVLSTPNAFVAFMNSL